MPTEEALPPDESLARRVRTGLAKVGTALKQRAWVEAGDGDFQASRVRAEGRTG